MSSGKYMHLGLKSNIETFLKNSVDQNIELLEIDIGIDGVLLTKSSSSQLWTILGHIVGHQFIFVVGIYHGYKKPYSADQFLIPFVDEFLNLHSNGLICHNKHIEVKIRSFICDAPARSLLLGKSIKIIQKRITIKYLILKRIAWF